MSDKAVSGRGTRRRWCLLAAVALATAGCAPRPQGTVTDPAAQPSPSARPEQVRDAPAASERAATVVRLAREKIGARYQWGGTGSTGYDCSGLVLTVFAEVGVQLPRTTRAQATVGQAVEPTRIRAGDLLFFGDGPKSVTHVGIATGRGSFVHSSQSRGVVEDSFESKYFRRRFVGARRVL